MKKIICLFILLLSFQIQANNSDNPLAKNGVITGKVIDANTKKPVVYVSIVIKDVTGKTITGGITDEEGNFKIDKIPEGNHTLEVQFMGYKTVSKPFSITNKKTKINLGEISFQEDAQSLDEVEIRADVSETIQKVDRKVINIGKDLVSSGATVSEIMNNIPSVSVDQDGNISLRGNSNVRVLVDGKPSTIDAATLLKQIPSTSIKSVELITNPSAKYNPEGMSGMINIVLKKNANMGFNGSLNTGVTFGEDPKYNASINMNYKTGKVNFYTNYGYNGGIWNNNGFVNRTSQGLNQDFIFKSDNESHLVKFGADIYINEKNTLSIFTNQNFSTSSGINSTLINDINNNANDLVQTNDSENKNDTQTYNLDYKLDFEKEGHNIEFEANHSTSKPKEDANFTKTPSDVFTDADFSVFNYFDDIDNERNNTIFNLDYVNPLDDNTKLELGFETRFRRTDNNRITNQDRLISENPNDYEKVPNSNFQYDQDIFSAYGTISKKIDKLSILLGVRVENYLVDANFKTFNLDNSINENINFNDDQINVYPSAFFTYNSSDKNQYQLSYSRRVDRPNLQQVNPIREWSTPFITSVGNQNLNPQFTNSIEFNYTRQLKKGSITLGTFYRHIKNNINRSIEVDPNDPDKLLLSHINSDSNNAYGVELSSNYRLNKWWSVNASFDLYTQKEEGLVGINKVNITNTNYNFRANNNFKATKNLSFTLFGMYRGPNKNLQFDVEEMYKIDIGARLKVLKGKGSISARFNDVFNTMHFAFTSDRPIDQVGKFFWESQTVYLGFNYRFGNGKNRTKSRKRRDNNEKQGGSGF